MEKQIEGSWVLESLMADGENLMDMRRKGYLFTSACDTIHFERKEIIAMTMSFDGAGNFTRTININISYPDTAAMRVQCAPVYADSVINNTQQGKWQLTGKSTIELIGDQFYEGNKVEELDDDKMTWQTDLIVESGFVLFKGVKTAQWRKKN